jgi:hypothetical protein
MELLGRELWLVLGGFRAEHGIAQSQPSGLGWLLSSYSRIPVLSGQGLRVPFFCRSITRIWYLTTSAKGTPPRICPVIMPGRETTPVTEIELMTGISATKHLARYCNRSDFAYLSGEGAIVTHSVVSGTSTHPSAEGRSGRSR